MPTDLLEPAGRCSGCWPHDGEVDGGAVGRFSFYRGPRIIATDRQAPRIYPQMIRLCSRLDSVLFTPKMSEIPSYGNYSRSPLVIPGRGGRWRGRRRWCRRRASAARYGVVDNTIAKSAALTLALRRVCALAFQAGGIVLFIGWRVGAKPTPLVRRRADVEYQKEIGPAVGPGPADQDSPRRSAWRDFGSRHECRLSGDGVEELAVQGEVAGLQT